VEDDLEDLIAAAEDPGRAAQIYEQVAAEHDGVAALKGEKGAGQGGRIASLHSAVTRT